MPHSLVHHTSSLCSFPPAVASSVNQTCLISAITLDLVDQKEYANGIHSHGKRLLLCGSLARL